MKCMMCVLDNGHQWGLRSIMVFSRYCRGFFFLCFRTLFRHFHKAFVRKWLYDIQHVNYTFVSGKQGIAAFLAFGIEM